MTMVSTSCTFTDSSVWIRTNWEITYCAPHMNAESVFLASRKMACHFTKTSQFNDVLSQPLCNILNTRQVKAATRARAVFIFYCVSLLGYDFLVRWTANKSWLHPFWTLIYFIYVVLTTAIPFNCQFQLTSQMGNLNKPSWEVFSWAMCMHIFPSSYDILRVEKLFCVCVSKF